MKPCANCGNPKILARRRCIACYSYLRKYGRERPEHVRIRYMSRLVDNDLARQSRRVV